MLQSPFHPAAQLPGALAGVSVPSPTTWKTKVGFAFALVCLGVTGTASYLSVIRLRDDDAWAGRLEESVAASRLLLSQITDAETAQRGYALTGDDSYLEPYHATQRTLQGDIQSLRALTAGNILEQRQLDALAVLVRQRMTRLGEEVALRRREGFVAAQAATETGVGKGQHDQIRRLTAQMEAAEQGALLQRQTAAHRGGELTTAIIVAGSLVPLVLVAGAFFTVGKRSRQALTAAQRQLTELRVLFDLIPALIWFKDAHNRILRVNQRAAAMVGKAVREIEGQKTSDIYPHEASKFYLSDLEVIRSGVPQLGLIEPLTNAEGGKIWVHTDKVPVCDRDGKVVGIVVMALDITERRKSIEALRESETRFRELAENIAEVFWIADPREARKLYLSPAYEKIWGRTCRSAYEFPHQWFDSIHPEDRERVRAALERKQTHGTFDVEYRIARPDGTERLIRDRAFPVREADGAIRRWVGVAEDITEYRAVKEQLEQTQKMDAMGTLAAGIAHDFNNILASINGYTELAQIELKGSPEVREYLTAVLRASSRAADLVRQILTFCRQERVDRRPIQLEPVVRECLELLRATLPSIIPFDTLLAADTPVVLADATQVHQIIMNLGTNAWHAMQDRPGRLEVRLERCVVDAVHAATAPHLHPGVYACLSVSDTGSGMDQATLRRIFEPFFTTKPIGAGTGLGLWVVHGIMDSHGGAITVYSQPGEGTVFHVYFPAHQGAAIGAPEPAAEVPRGHGEHVLVVDDEEGLARLGQKSLAALGYDAEFTTEPATALARVRAEPGRFALVLTDQTMPGMTGLELAGRLREILPGLPVILTTGFAQSLTPDRMESAGVRQLLLKPTTLHSLGTSVHAALAGAR